MRFPIAETTSSFDGSIERSTSVAVRVVGYAKLFGMHESPNAVYAVFI